MTTQNIAGNFQGYCNFFPKVVQKYLFLKKVLGKEEGDKKDNDKKNWHGHVTVNKNGKNYIKTTFK